MAGAEDRLAEGGLPERQDEQGRGGRNGQVSGPGHREPGHLTWGQGQGPDRQTASHSDIDRDRHKAQQPKGTIERRTHKSHSMPNPEPFCLFLKRAQILQ